LIRTRFPAGSVSDIYQCPNVGALAARLTDSAVRQLAAREIAPTPRRTGLAQTLLTAPLLTVVGLRWVVALAAINNVLAVLGGGTLAPTVSWWWVALGWLLVISPVGRIAIAAGGARRPVAPGCCCAGCGRVVTRVVAVSTCDCGWPSGWPS
jgi:hypothetical protein